jgi:hypothetical protein
MRFKTVTPKLRKVLKELEKMKCIFHVKGSVSNQDDSVSLYVTPYVACLLVSGRAGS